MILFKNDFKTQNAFIDYQTTNISFIRMSRLLKDMRIENNKFFLALTQKELIGVNPHDEKNLTTDLKFRIAYEAKINPWYYFREVVRVPAQGTDAIPFILNRATLALYWAFFNDIDSFLTMPRQIGKTIGTLALSAWLIYLATKKFNMAMLAKDTALVQENVKRLKGIRDELPSYLISKSIKDTDNKEGIYYSQLDTQYQTFVAQSSVLGAHKQGRGLSTAAQHWDEVAYYKNIGISYPGAVAATNTAVDQARAAGLPSANILTTTAGDLTDPDGQYAYEICQDALKFSESLYDTEDRATLEKLLEKNSNNNMLYIVYSYLQLGKTHEWLKEKTSRAKATQQEIEKDYLNIWQTGSGSNIVPKHLMDKLKEFEIEPIKCTTFNDIILRWYVDPEVMETDTFKNKPFVISVDMSENVGRDFTTMVILDPADMSVVCTCYFNESNPVYLSNWLVNFLLKFRKAIFIPERNLTGSLLIDMIVSELESHGINPFERIYNTVIQDWDKKEYLNLSTIDIQGDVRKKFGFRTTSGQNSRKLLFKTVLIKAIELNYSRIYDSKLIQEIFGLTIRNGRIDHGTNGHDDLLMAYLIACFFVFYGNNLDMYGIDKNEFLSQVADNGNKVDPTLKMRQLAIQDRLVKLEKLVKGDCSPLVKKSYENELRSLRAQVKPDIINKDTVSKFKRQSENNAQKKAMFGNTPQDIYKFMYKIA